MVLNRLCLILSQLKTQVIACSGGLDSLLLATVSHRLFPDTTVITHAAGPAVPKEATERCKRQAKKEGWDLLFIETGELQDENYFNNPYDRCFHCKRHLYSVLKDLASKESAGKNKTYTVTSGANQDDLGEYRPGLRAAEEFGVRHPFIEAGMGKEDIRSLARTLRLDFAELPASPCLSSRIYTGTPVTAERLRLVERAETLLKQWTGLEVVRCRVQGGEMRIETQEEERGSVTDEILQKLSKEIEIPGALLERVVRDPKPYRPGRAFIAP